MIGIGLFVLPKDIVLYTLLHGQGYRIEQSKFSWVSLKILLVNLDAARTDTKNIYSEFSGINSIQNKSAKDITKAALYTFIYLPTEK